MKPSSSDFPSFAAGRILEALTLGTVTNLASRSNLSTSILYSAANFCSSSGVLIDLRLARRSLSEKPYKRFWPTATSPEALDSNRVWLLAASYAIQCQDSVMDMRVVRTGRIVFIWWSTRTWPSLLRLDKKSGSTPSLSMAVIGALVAPRTWLRETTYPHFGGSQLSLRYLTGLAFRNDYFLQLFLRPCLQLRDTYEPLLTLSLPWRCVVKIDCSREMRGKK